MSKANDSTTRPQIDKISLDITSDNNIRFSTKLLNKLCSLYIFAAESKNQKLFFEYRRLVTRIFDSQLRLNFGISVFLLLVIVMSLIFNLSACLAFTL